jgi:O-antigen/teichoic acid export membrane protein
LIFAGLGSLILAGRLDPLAAIAAYITAPAVMTVAGLIAIRRLFSWRLGLKADAVKRMLSFSLPLIPYSLIGYFSTNYLDAIFISQYLSRSDLGVYSVAYQMNGILMQFPLLAGSLLLPLFVTLRTGGNTERVNVYMESVLPLLTLIGAFGGICAALAMKFFIPLAFGQQADQAVIVFWILISSAVFAIPTIIGFAPYTNAVSATYIASITAVVAAAVNLAANYFLIPGYGLKGCAWATVLAYGASVLVVVAIGRFRFSIGHKWTIPAFIPALTASVYASATGDLITAFVIALAAAFVIVLIWRKDVMNGVRILKDYRAFAAG